MSVTAAKINHQQAVKGSFFIDRRARVEHSLLLLLSHICFFFF